MKIGECCNREVVMMNGEESVGLAAELMRKHHVGDVVLVEERDGKNIPIGIVTDRDLVVEVMALGLEARDLAVQNIVTRSVLIAKEEDSLFETLKFMRVNGVRRLPVVDVNKRLIGIITLDDITELLTEMLYDVVGIVKREQKGEESLRFW